MPQDKSFIESDGPYKALFETSTDAFLVIEDNAFINCNQATLDMLGYDKKTDIYNIHPSKISPEYQPDGQLSETKAELMIATAFEKGNHRFEWEHMRKSGEVFPVEVLLIVIPFKGKSLLHVVWRDITERKQFEEKLLVSDLRLKMVAKASGTVIWDWNIVTNEMDWDESYYQVYGYSKEDTLPTPESWSNFIHPDDKDHTLDSLNKIVETGEIQWDAEYRFKKKDGSYAYTLDWGTVMHDPNGKPIRMIGIMLDITDQKLAEQELLNARKLESVGLLAGGIAHDFNNILAGLFGNIELAKLKLSSDHAAYQHIQTANQAMDRAASLTSQLLTFAKGGDPLFEIVDIKPIIWDSIKFSLSGSNVKPILTLQEDLWMLNADKGQLSQVITNLLINAGHAMPRGGNLIIEAFNIEEFTNYLVPNLSGEFVCLKISDEGVGISEEQKKHIFDPYFTTKKSGSGLGLATAHSIIAKHNGYISVESELDKGTTFSIYLPAKLNAQIVDKVLLDDTNNPIEYSGNILVMDDEQMILDVSADMLKSLGYSVETAIDGQQVIEKYIDADKCGNPFDVVIMDLTIPGGMGGEDVIKELLGINPQVKAIVSSGYSTSQIMSNYTEYGFKGRLVKPFQMKALGNELSKILN